MLRFAFDLEWLDEGKRRRDCSARGDVTHVSQLKGSSSDYWWYRRVYSQHSSPAACWHRKPGPDWFIQAAKVWLWRHSFATLDAIDSVNKTRVLLPSTEKLTNKDINEQTIHPTKQEKNATGLTKKFTKKWRNEWTDRPTDRRTKERTNEWLDGRKD